MRVAVLAGGETTVRVTGDGVGGRNQELALSAAVALHNATIADDVDVVVLACGTDGSDGPTAATGAVVTRSTVSHAARAGVDAARHLGRNDSHTFFVDGVGSVHVAPPSAVEDGDDDAAAAVAGCSDHGGAVITGPTGTNVMDIVVALCQRRC
jgi:glycerate-2-kinase